MADDDLFSLDFTAPGALPPVETAPPPAPEPAKPKLELELAPRDEAPALPPAPAPAPAAIAPTPTAAPAPPALPAPLLQAAELHAAGDTLGASKILEAALKSGARFGTHTDFVWLGLFEVLNDLGRRDAFDKLALTYAQHLEKSPPAWIEPSAHEAAHDSGSDAVVHLPEVLDAGVGPQLKEMVLGAGPNVHLLIDVSAVKKCDDGGATLLLRGFKALAGAKRDYDLLGAEALAKCLGETLEPMARDHEPQWLLLIALFDHLDQQDAFEEAAVNYAVTFEVSPPMWETRERANRSKPTPKPAVAAAASATPALRGVVSGDAAALAESIVQGSGELQLDASGLKRIEHSAAEALLPALRQRRAAGAGIRISALPPLPYILLCHLGWDEVATLQARKA